MPVSNPGFPIQRGIMSGALRHSRNTNPNPLGGSVTTEPDVLIWNALSFNNVGASSNINTFSIAPTANALILISVLSAFATLPNTPTVTGSGLTWSLASSIPFGTIASPTRRLSIFFAQGAAPSSGVLNVDFGGQLQTGIVYAIKEFLNADISVAGGGGAIANSDNNRADATANPNITMGHAISDPANAILMMIADDVNAANDCAPPTGFSEDFEVNNAAPAMGLSAAYNLHTAGIVYNATATARNWAVIAVEIKPTTKPVGQMVGYVFNDGNGLTNGVTLSGALFDSANHGSGLGGMGFTPAVPTGFTVAAPFATRLNSVRVGPTIYTPSGIPEHHYALDNTNNFTYGSAQPQSQSTFNFRRQISLGCFVQFGPGTFAGGQLYDMLYFTSALSGHFAVFQLRNGTGSGGINYEVNIETNPGGVTTHSVYSIVTQSQIAWICFLLDMLNGQAKFQAKDAAATIVIPTVTAVYDTSNLADYVGNFRAGNVEVGNTAGTSKYGPLIINPSGTFPFGP